MPSSTNVRRASSSYLILEPIVDLRVGPRALEPRRISRQGRARRLREGCRRRRLRRPRPRRAAPAPAPFSSPGRVDVGNASAASRSSPKTRANGPTREKCRGTGLGGSTGSSRSSSAATRSSSSSTVISEPDSALRGPGGALACSSAHAPTRPRSDPPSLTRLDPPNPPMTPTGESLNESLSAYRRGSSPDEGARPLGRSPLLPRRSEDGSTPPHRPPRAFLSPGW